MKLLFRSGVDLVHLRKPDATAEQCAATLGRLSVEERSRVVTHQHFMQAVEFGLHGIHLNRRCPEPLSGYAGSVSRSCHSLEEVAEWKPYCDYVFLSPIFNSISKRGREAAFSSGELADAASRGVIDGKVCALGGVTPERLSELKRLNFGAAAMLGCVNALAVLPAAEAERRLRAIRSYFR